jgi:hypothetical protein
MGAQITPAEEKKQAWRFVLVQQGGFDAIRPMTGI